MAAPIAPNARLRIRLALCHYRRSPEQTRGVDEAVHRSAWYRHQPSLVDDGTGVVSRLVYRLVTVTSPRGAALDATDLIPTVPRVVPIEGNLSFLIRSYEVCRTGEVPRPPQPSLGFAPPNGVATYPVASLRKARDNVRNRRLLGQCHTPLCPAAGGHPIHRL